MRSVRRNSALACVPVMQDCNLTRGCHEWGAGSATLLFAPPAAARTLKFATMQASAMPAEALYDTGRT